MGYETVINKGRDYESFIEVLTDSVPTRAPLRYSTVPVYSSPRVKVPRRDLNVLRFSLAEECTTREPPTEHGGITSETDMTQGGWVTDL